MRSPNVDGKHYLLIVLAPIRAEEAQPLAAYLEGLRAGGAVSPFARLPRTHIARWIVLPDLPQDRGARPDRLDGPYLLFTCAFDGDLDSYLDELCDELAPEAAEIWGRCIGCPRDVAGGELKRYLAHNQIDAGYFFSAYRDATAPDVRRALDKRARLQEFAVRAQAIDDPAARRQAFLEAFG